MSVTVVGERLNLGMILKCERTGILRVTSGEREREVEGEEEEEERERGEVGESERVTVTEMRLANTGLSRGVFSSSLIDCRDMIEVGEEEGASSSSLDFLTGV